MPGSNVVPSGASLTIQSGGTITASPGSTVTGFGGGGGSGTVTSLTATAPIVVTPTPLTTTGVISITGAALTKTDDTNVTLTLGGTPATSLLAATSITAGWTGTLAVARGGTGGATATANTVFGNNTGSTAAPGFQTLVDAQVPNTLTLTAASNLTTNGFVKTSGGAGTLSVDTSTYLTANQSISLTGDVTGGPAATSIATTIGANKVTLGMMATMATDSILGRATASTGNVEVLSALPFAFTGDVTRPVDSNAQTIANSAVTYAKMQNVSASSKLLGSSATGSGAPPSEITLGTNLSMSGSTLNATGGAGTWGTITGTLSSQTDLQTALDGKVSDTGDTMTGALDLPQGLVTAPSLTFGTGVNSGFYATGTGATAVFNTAVNGSLKWQVATSTSTLTVPLRGASGAVGLPGYAFSAESTSGIYRAGSGDVRMSMSGGDTMKWLGSDKSTTFFGKAITIAGTTAAASLNLPHGAAPTTPVNGDMWSTTTGLYAQINGATVGPLGTGGGGGNVSNSGTPTADQLPIWVTATTIKGVTAVSGGTTGQVLKKNSATDYDWAWAADAGGVGSGDVVGPASATDNAIARFDTTTGKLIQDSLVTIDDTTGMLSNAGTIPGITATGAATDINIYVVPKGGGFLQVSTPYANGTTLQLNNTSVGGLPWQFTSQGSASGQPGHFAFYNGTNTVMDLSGTQIGTHNAGMFSWWSGATYAGVGTIDTALARNAAGVVEVNNGTAGTYRDLKADEVNAVTGFQVNGAAPANYELTGNGTDFVAKASDIPNGSSAQQTGFASNTYLAGSVVTINAGDFKVGGTYRCLFDMTKTTAGTAAPVITIYIGTNGTTADTAAQTITFAVATGVADTGIFEVWVNFRAVGASATIASHGRCTHNLAATGLTSTGAAGDGHISNSTSSTFNSTAATKIGIAFNGGASYAGTCNIVQAFYQNP